MKLELLRLLKFAGGGILGGAMFYLGGHPFYIWPLLFVSAGVVVFAALSRHSLIEILLFSLFFVMTGFAGLIAISWSVVISIAVVVGLTLLYALGIWLSARQFRKKRVLMGALAFASFFAAVDYLISLSNIGTATSPAYSLYSYLPSVQIAEITGVWGVTFMIYLVGATLGAIAFYRRNFKKYLYLLLLTVVLIAADLGFGYWRLSGLAEPGSYIRSATVCIREKGGDVIDRPADFSLRWAERYGKLVEKAALDMDAMLVVWPEEVLKVTDATRDTLRSYIAALSRKFGIYQVVGVYDSTRNLNLAWVISPGGELLTEYHKHHIVPYVDRAAPGRDEPEVVEVEGVKLGIVICNDEVFTDLTRNLGRKGAQIVADPSWDWPAVYERHARIVPMRAVENRFSMVRSTKNGIAQIIAPTGEVIENKNTLIADETILVGDVPVGMGKTFYARHGDIFAFLMIAIAILAVVV